MLSFPGTLRLRLHLVVVLLTALFVAGVHCNGLYGAFMQQVYHIGPQGNNLPQQNHISLLQQYSGGPFPAYSSSAAPHNNGISHSGYLGQPQSGHLGQPYSGYLGQPYSGHLGQPYSGHLGQPYLGYLGQPYSGYLGQTYSGYQGGKPNPLYLDQSDPVYLGQKNPGQPQSGYQGQPQNAANHTHIPYQGQDGGTRIQNQGTDTGTALRKDLPPHNKQRDNDRSLSRGAPSPNRSMFTKDRYNKKDSLNKERVSARDNTPRKKHKSKGFQQRRVASVNRNHIARKGFIHKGPQKKNLNLKSPNDADSLEEHYNEKIQQAKDEIMQVRLIRFMLFQY